MRRLAETDGLCYWTFGLQVPTRSRSYTLPAEEPGARRHMLHRAQPGRYGPSVVQSAQTW
jgi:hypothetical protein